ncbi:MAG: hypothetical protein FWG78_04500 [Coriobacteriia bacterium]|nr:hypothetical protein [Coriobacteriia bacterium]
MSTNSAMLSTKVSPEIRERFEELAGSYGTSPAAALRMLTYAFVKAEGFPYAMSGQKETIRETSVVPLEAKTFLPALEKMQESMTGQAEKAGLVGDEDVMALVREVRYKETA